MTKYLDDSVKFFGEDTDIALKATRGNDASIAIMYSGGKAIRDCLLARYTVGNMETESGGCIANGIVMNLMLAVIVTIIAVRYSMALLFQWVISKRLVKPGGRSNWLAWRSIKGGNDDPANHIPGPYNNYGPMNIARGSSASVSSGGSSSRGTPHSEQSSALNLGNNPTDIVSTELYSVMLVTCYSEGEDGLRTTMDSLAETTYSKKHKCFFVIADGMITGAGESKSTPDIVVDMMDLDPTMANPKSCSYLAIADGEKQLNMAKVVCLILFFLKKNNFVNLIILFFQFFFSMLVITKMYLVSLLSSVVRKKNKMVLKQETVVNVILRLVFFSSLFDIFSNKS